MKIVDYVNKAYQSTATSVVVNGTSTSQPAVGTVYDIKNKEFGIYAYGNGTVYSSWIWTGITVELS